MSNNHSNINLSAGSTNSNEDLSDEKRSLNHSEVWKSPTIQENKEDKDKDKDNDADHHVSFVAGADTNSIKDRSHFVTENVGFTPHPSHFPTKLSGKLYPFTPSTYQSGHYEPSAEGFLYEPDEDELKQESDIHSVFKLQSELTDIKDPES